ncbi:protein FAM110C-like [Protopterus annectens]|uniref:protein FAM110C-like n=1 Tax=Protopterus annectens TaxID=7888 RepID=UPI001CFA4EBE|nr:protein FAM110C-like [Protopterus annectens]
MPTELSRTLRMQAVSELSASLPRLLNKGPGYLRKQIEGENKGRISAVERLAADKAKYVKSEQVIRTKQEVVTQCSASESSSENCSVNSRKSYNESQGKKDAENIDLNNLKNDVCTPSRKGSPIVKRNSSKKQTRPDSLVMYRQKCELVKGQNNEPTRVGLVKRLFQGTHKEKTSPSLEVSKLAIKEQSEHANNRVETQAIAADLQKTPVIHHHTENTNITKQHVQDSVLPRQGHEGPEATAGDKRRPGLQRSLSDISSRYSKSFSEFDSFFKYCGLEPEVIEDLGKDNFSAVTDNVSFRIRSISTATSDSGFSRHSSDNGLLEEELHEQGPSTTSVIERNARIIKWLYSCKKAKEAVKVFQELT